MKKWLFRSIGVIALVGGLATLAVGTVLAQEQGPEDGQAQRAGRAGLALVQRMSEATGLPVEGILGQLQGGQTPAEILSQHGVDPDAFVADTLADLRPHLDEAVANGRIDQVRADEIYQQAAERLPQAMNQTFENAGAGRRQGEDEGQHPLRRRIARGIFTSLMDATGLTREGLAAEFQAGKTIGEIVIEHGGDPDLFVTGFLTNLRAKLDEAVSSGQIDQTRADEIYAAVSEKLPELMNQSFEFENRPGSGQGV